MRVNIHYDPERYDELDKALDTVMTYVSERAFSLHRTAVPKAMDLAKYIYDDFEKQRKKDESIEAQIEHEKERNEAKKRAKLERKK